MVAISLLLSGCASGPQATEEDMRRISPEPYGMLFDAVIETLVDLGCEIVSADKQGFFIAAIKEGSIASEKYSHGYARLHFAFHSGLGDMTIQASIFTARKDGSNKTMATKRAYDKFWGLLGKNLDQPMSNIRSSGIQ